MKDIIKHFELDGVEYPLVFNLNVMEEIQEEYETYTDWIDMISGSDKEVNIKALKFGITKMINEGIDIENEQNGKNRVFITEKKVGRMISDLGIEQMTASLQDTVISSTKVEEETKNV